MMFGRRKIKHRGDPAMPRNGRWKLAIFVAWALFMASFWSVTQAASLNWKEYGRATTVTFNLFNSDGTLDVDEVDGGTEVTVHCDEDAGTTATNDFVDEGSYYSIALTASEMQCARVTLDINATLREVVHIETYGGQNAEHQFGPNIVRQATAQAGASGSITLDASASATIDFYNHMIVRIVDGTGVGQARVVEDYNQTTKVATVENWNVTPDSTSIFQIVQDYRPYVNANGRVEADVLQISGDATAADNAELVFDNTGYNMSNSTMGTVSALASGAVDATALASDAVAEIWAHVCETNGSRACDDILAWLLAEALGRCSAPADGSTWTCSDPDNTTTRFSITYGTDNGDRTSVTLTAP